MKSTMKVENHGSPTLAALELEEEFRRSGLQLDATRGRLRAAEARAAEALAQRQEAAAAFATVSSVGSGALGLAPILGDMAGQALPSAPVAVAQKAWALLDELAGVTEAAVTQASETSEQLRARGRSIVEDRHRVDQQMQEIRAALLAQSRPRGG